MKHVAASMDDATELAMRLLSAMGCKVRVISECDDKRADLCAVDGNATYLVEVKHKIDDLELRRNHAECMSRGQIACYSRPVGHNNRISSILQHARDQLDSTPGPPGAFRLIWFYVSGIDRDLHWRRAFSTFYGRVHLLPLKPPGNPIECYYFDYSTAWTLPSVDGMVLSDDRGIQLLMNEFGGNVELFCNSGLYKTFAKWKAIIDPRKLAANGEILACRSDVPRKDDDCVLSAMHEQTGVLYTAIRFSQESASAMVDRETEK